LVQVSLTREEIIYCETLYNLLPLVSVWISETFGLIYYNADTPITDLVCALFGSHTAML